MKSVLVIMFMMLPIQIEWKDFKSETKGFSIKYPKTWEAKDLGEFTAFVSPLENSQDKFQENVNVMVKEVKTESLEQLAEISSKQVISKFGNNSMESSKIIKFLGMNSSEFVFYMNMRGMNMKVKQLCFLKNKKAYYLTYTAETKDYSRYEQTAQTIMEGFHFL